MNEIWVPFGVCQAIPRDSNIAQVRNIPEIIVGSLIRFKVGIFESLGIWGPKRELHF